MARTARIENGQIITRDSRVLAEPTGDDLGMAFAKRLRRIRQHRRQWPEPTDAHLILNMHFRTHNAGRNHSHYAEMTLEVPVKGGFDYYTVMRGAKTKHDALIAVIQEIEASSWYTYFRAKQVRFRVTGCDMEKLYRGYL